MPLLALWMFSPQVAYLINRPIVTKTESLTARQETKLRALARVTWLFFEAFIGPEDHWLPPDHFQESPRGIVAHRTSPTNIGLGLLSTLAAYDFGYIEAIDFAARLRAAFDSLEKLERYRGHFINWYDTRKLLPLSPRYVSTVDSGNLAAALIALRSGCLELAGRPVIRSESWAGLTDMLHAVDGLLEDWEEKVDPGTVREIRGYLAGFILYIETVGRRPDRWRSVSDQLTGQAADVERDTLSYKLTGLEKRLIDLLEAHAPELTPGDVRRLRIYTRRARQQLDGFKRQLGSFVPWYARLDHPPGLLTAPDAPEPVRIAWGRLSETVRVIPRLDGFRDLLSASGALLHELRALVESTGGDGREVHETLEWLDALQADLDSGSGRAFELSDELRDLAGLCEEITDRMDFGFLYDPHRKVFHLGYNVELDRLDNNYYDLLASEASIASIVAIAKGNVPQSHWLHLGRPVTRVGGERALVSWSATKFE
jgi:cyclic beta-1,2-glucan synthetase